MSLSLVATCPLGVEELLERELRELGVRGIRRGRAAVTFAGSWREVYRANWRLRTANRVLVELGTWDGTTGESLAAGAEELVRSSREWDGLSAKALFAPGATFSIRATSARSRQRDSRWIGLKVKDGLVDAQRHRYGRRASVERSAPDLGFRVRLDRDRASFLLDTSGASLDHRGYRLEAGPAPLREHLAAACVLAADWDGAGPVVDPMCGAGTLLAEAAAWALGLAPGRLRSALTEWALARLPNFDSGLWHAVRREAIPAPGRPGRSDGPAGSDRELRLVGIDRDREALRAARSNLDRAGLSGTATLVEGDGFAYEPPPGPGLLVVNPPYGERIGEERAQWSRLGDLMKQHYTGWRAVVLAGDEGKGKHIGLKPRLRLPVRNGPLDARILVFDLY
ncbi:MAG: THUMP domain-containing protein [Acidobacteriota bacterium]|jgi:23S rRNA G2445 N2-methylase RlmL